MSDNKELAPVEKRKPPSAGRGRKKGELNKLTRSIKDAIEASFEKVGGAEYLARMAEQEPVAYMSLLAKILPAQINANVSGVIGMPAITLGVQPE